MTIVPMPFSLLFIMPIAGGFIIFDRTASIRLSLAFYLSTQILLAFIAKSIYS